ncbi:3-dehydroquinate synthase [Treponema brennaborense]|uniref:3-dehydroquinate synthase n=1 Tax=Treponema brennaborense (strain DSM 12168 / CIP 105900 / DD5/3) TaxID=906968 RepID=F4LPL5_TREBD|nr:3-dehydroquinate synthase family protein [Treponema brennaborense]AEE17011.1 3-dehydroquinate synthase [Treponema brennaborense DSM 12168]
MTQDTFSITYTAVHPGTDKTDIVFCGDTDSHAFADAYAPGKSAEPRLFVTDETVASLPLLKDFTAAFTQEPPRAGKTYLSGNDALLVLGAGEPYKTIESVLAIIRAALENNLQRSSVFTGIGGGVVCDMTAFAASLFKRGARLELVPTTLLAMVDAAVGGKTGCDFEAYKNMIGTFYPAARLRMYSEFIPLLPESEYRSGLAETVKTGLLYAPKLFDILERQKDAVMRRDTDVVRQLIKRCVIAKANIVEKDLTETGLRMQLNFGHTFAHALETCAGLGTVSHGDAVGWGMARALDLSHRLGLCSAEYRDEVCAVLASYGWETAPVHSALSGSGRTAAQTAAALIEAMKKDKKNTPGAIRCILQRDMNSTVVQEAAEADIAAVLGA